MYRFAARITPEGLASVAQWLYIEMLKAGYTSVCEFHYLHHTPDGSPMRTTLNSRNAWWTRRRRAASA